MVFLNHEFFSAFIASSQPLILSFIWLWKSETERIADSQVWACHFPSPWPPLCIGSCKLPFKRLLILIEDFSFYEALIFLLIVLFLFIILVKLPFAYYCYSGFFLVCKFTFHRVSLRMVPQVLHFNRHLLNQTLNALYYGNRWLPDRPQVPFPVQFTWANYNNWSICKRAGMRTRFVHPDVKPIVLRMICFLS